MGVSVIVFYGIVFGFWVSLGLVILYSKIRDWVKSKWL